MGKVASFLSMQQAIMTYINSKIPKNPNTAHRGTISGGRVVIENKSYPYDPAVDIYFGEGDGVYCLLPDKGNIAAVVGVS